ncbi:MAG: hypothetical protein CMA15_02575 [Euryarchaeota archaeon]|nr:hypothetical protein [Euryarchaeota archaeon]
MHQLFNGFSLLSLKVSLDVWFLLLNLGRFGGSSWPARMLAFPLIATATVLLGRILGKRIELVLLSPTTSAVD